MRRPFFWPAAGLGLGILLGRFVFPVSLKYLFVTVFSLFPFLWVFRGRRAFLFLFFLLLTGLGFLRIHQALGVRADDISHFAGGDWVSLEGEVASLPEMKEKGRKKIVSFVLNSKSLVRHKEFFEVTGKAQVFLFNPPGTPPFGGRIRLRGRLALAKAPNNPGEFDYRKYLADQGIGAVLEGYHPHSLKIIRQPSAGIFSPFVALQRLREFSAARFDRLFDPPCNRLLKALILGLRRDFPEDFRDDFAKTGTAHLFAISGMNITLIAGSLFFLALFLGLPQKASALAGLLAAVGYVFLSGAGVPVVRAGWMAGIFFIGLLLERKKDWLNSLFFAFFVILAADPMALFQVGFQLSFLSVFFLLTLTRFHFEKAGDGFQTVIVLIGTFPLGIAYFNLFSWTAFFANLLAIPFFHLGVLGGFGSLAVGEIPWLGPLCMKGTRFFLGAGLAWIRFWAAQPWGYSHLKTPAAWLYVCYYGSLLGVWWAWRTEKSRRPFVKALSASLWLLAAGLFFWPSGRENFRLTLLSAGQNELAHIQFPGGRHWLVNAGRGAPSDQARWILAPFLRQTGVKHLEGIFLTDFSKRHTGGLRTLFSNFSAGHLLYPVTSGVPPAWKNRGRPRPIPVLAADRVPLGEGTEFRILEVVRGKAVLLVDYRGNQFLFLPAADSETLQRVADRWDGSSSIEALIFPAYGQPSQSVWREALSKFLPQQVIFTKNNAAVAPLAASLREEEIPFLFLSETGAIRFEFHKGRFLVSSHHPKKQGTGHWVIWSQ